ncbi:MAG: hypothetical protein HY897_02505 [Deltaproteobacteria bacterium]|nr:hypothetical protein [Deltaproteobacteria bacterium]
MGESIVAEPFAGTVLEKDAEDTTWPVVGFRRLVLQMYLFSSLWTAGLRSMNG